MPEIQALADAYGLLATWPRRPDYLDHLAWPRTRFGNDGDRSSMNRRSPARLRSPGGPGRDEGQEPGG